MIFTFINFILCIIIFIPAIIILFTIIGKKPYKVKEDILFIEKLFLKCGILLFYFILSLYELLNEGENDNEKLFKIKTICFNAYIVLLFMNNFFLCLENYFTYNNPIHYFNSLFNKSKYNITYEIISILCSFIVCLPYFEADKCKSLIIIINDKENEFEDTELNEQSPFIISNIFILILALVINITILVLYFLLKFKIKKLIFKARGKFISILNEEIIVTFFYVLFIIWNFSCFMIIIDKKKREKQIFLTVNSYIFLLVFLIDSFFEFKKYSTSKFSQYKLKNTIVGSVGAFFNRKNIEDYPSNTFIDSMLISSHNNTKMNNSQDEEESENDSILMPINSHDIELVLIYRNNIFIEDYFYYYYDFVMNIILSSLFKVYRSKKFSTSVVKNDQLKKELNITESAIFGIGDKTSNTIASNYTLKKIDTTEPETSSYTINQNTNSDTFEYIRNSERNDFSYSESIFTNTEKDFSYDNIKITITSYFTNKCVYNLLEKNLTNKVIGDSLMSHLNEDNNSSDNGYVKINKNDISSDINDGLPYHSILACNAKEEYFLHLKNMSIKTYDKQLTFDIFESNNEEIDLDKNNSNVKIAKMIDRYFNYIAGVGVMETFLPILLGIFKVKINSFKTMLIYVSFNSLIENSPLSTYSYWQLVRFSYNDKEKVGSSKYKHNVLIGDDLIFDRKYAVPSSKEDIDDSYNKIEVKNYFNFQETIKHDIEFLKESGIKYSNLLMMYFEYENAQKHETEGAIKIKKIDDNKAEIINTTVPMPIFREDDDEESDENLYIGDFSKKHESEVATIPAIPNSSSEMKDDKKSNDTSNRISVLNNLNINEGKKEIESKNSKSGTNQRENLDIDSSRSFVDKNSNLNKCMSNNRFQSICGSLTNEDFLNDTMVTFDEHGSGKNKLGVQNHSMLNYSEKIKINGYDGYFDAFNCMCLFSFENIFNLDSGCFCRKINFNQLQKNILNNFHDYLPRKHTVLTSKKNKSK